MKGGRKLSQWNIFVKKIWEEGRAKNPKYEFKQALKDASERKSEMGSSKSVAAKGTKSRKGSRKSRGKKSMSMAGGKSRKNRKH